MTTERVKPAPVSVHTYHFFVETGSCERDCVITLMTESCCPGRRTWFFRYRHILNKFVKKKQSFIKRREKEMMRKRWATWWENEVSEICSVLLEPEMSAGSYCSAWQPTQSRPRVVHVSLDLWFNGNDASIYCVNTINLTMPCPELYGIIILYRYGLSWDFGLSFPVN